MEEHHNDEDKESCSCEEWSSESSYSDSESSVPEWEPFVEPNGQLFYIDCHPKVSHMAVESEPDTSFSTRSQIRQSTRSKFLKLLRRHNSKRYKPQESSQSDSNKVTFHDHQEGEIREVFMKVDHENRKLGRRGTLVESLLGLTVSTLSDGNRVMVAGIMPDSEAVKQKGIKIGDWLKSINDIEVTYDNLDAVLERFSNLTEVTLKLQRVAGIEVTKHPPINELSTRSDFVQLLTNSNEEHIKMLNEAMISELMGVLFLNTERLSESSPEFEEVLYCFPTPREKNTLCLSRGTFLTLNHLVNELVSFKPTLSSTFCNNELAHVVYMPFNSKLLVIMLPSKCLSMEEALLMTKEIVRSIEFMYQTVENYFELGSLKKEVDHFFLKIFARILWPNNMQPLNVSKKKDSTKSRRQFEQVLMAAKYLILPKEAQMQIDDALTELEACDYREWNEEPLDCQRLFTVLGSALFHSSFLLASHFVHDDLIDIHCFCRQQGLFHLSETEPVKSLVLWREVFPLSCNRGIHKPESLFKMPEGRRYLLVVGSGKELLTVLMEAGGCTEPAEENLGPDAFYVEEAEATLSHLNELGIPDVAERCLLTNPGNQVVIPEKFCEKRKSDFFSSLSKSTLSLNKESPVQPQKKMEVTSILKRRSSDQGPLYSSGSILSWTDENLDDSISQGSYSEKSEVSDEPVLGRRAIREKRSFMDSPDEESDVEDYREGSQMSCNSFDLSELRQNLIMESEDMQPMRLTAGAENVLFHYVQLDLSEGILLVPPPCKVSSQMLDIVLENFRTCCQTIHRTFQNTLRFKDMLAQDKAHLVTNKSLIAIREYGMLFECIVTDDSSKKTTKFNYWVVGRLFYVPHPREVYICYHESVPQNIIEVAYNLGLALA